VPKNSPEITGFFLEKSGATAPLRERRVFDGNIDQKSIAHLRSVAGRIPVCAPAQDELFYLNSSRNMPGISKTRR
jgi:hypothetical protein